MNQSQEFRKSPEAEVVKKSVKVMDENLELAYSNENLQMRSSTVADAAYTAYDAIEMHKTFQKSRRSYNEERERYEEEAFSSEQQPSQSSSIEPVPVQGIVSEDNSGMKQTNPLAISEWKSPALKQLEDSRSFHGNDNGMLSLGQAETPKMWANTNDLQKNKKLQEKLEGRRKDVQRGYTRFSIKYGDKELSTKPRHQFNYYGRINISGGEKKLGDFFFGRLKYTGQVKREKMTRKDYEEILKEKGKKGFERRVKGRLLFRETKSLVEDEEMAEDDTVRRMKGTVRNAGRIVAAGTRRNIRTVRLQNNTYYRLELAQMHEQVLKDKRSRLVSDARRREQKEALKAAKSK